VNGLLAHAVLPAACGAAVGWGAYLAARGLRPLPTGSAGAPGRRANRAGTAGTTGRAGRAGPAGRAGGTGRAATPATTTTTTATADGAWGGRGGRAGGRFGGWAPRAGWAADVNSGVEQALGRHRARRLLLADDLAVVGGDPAAHTARRLGHGLAAAGTAAALAVVALAAGVGFPVPLAGAGCLAAAAAGIAAADRPVRRTASARRREARLAVASFVDLVRILLVGGLPLHAALAVAADAGRGWAYGEIRAALAWARARHLPPDAGLDLLATRVGLAAFAELRLTVGSALRGASPVVALASKATHLRAAEAAQARAETATADAEMELPAAVVALAFVAFLAFPLLAVLTGTGAAP
jgi:hypothetical protein